MGERRLAVSPSTMTLRQTFLEALHCQCPILSIFGIWHAADQGIKWAYQNWTQIQNPSYIMIVSGRRLGLGFIFTTSVGLCFEQMHSSAALIYQLSLSNLKQWDAGLFLGSHLSKEMLKVGIRSNRVMLFFLLILQSLCFILHILLLS